MPKVQKPTNDRERIAQLERVIEVVNAASGGEQLAVHIQFHQGAEPLLGESLVAAISVTAPQFSDLLRQVEQQESIHHNATLVVARTMKRLQLVLRQQIDALRWHVRTGNATAALLRYYGLPLDGALPTSRRRTLWLALANTLLQRDKLADGVAVPTLVDPAALEEAYRDAEKAIAGLGATSRLLRGLRAARRSVRKDADVLIGQLRAELTFHLRAESPTTRRQIMRDYGIQFRPTPGDVSQVQEEETVSVALTEVL